jgi:hypothetical protein
MKCRCSSQVPQTTSRNKKKTTQAVHTTPHISSGGISHIGTKHRKISLPADKKKGRVREKKPRVIEGENKS